MQPKVVAPHCQVHSFNLEIKSSMKNSMIIRDVLGNVCEIITFMKCSPKLEQSSTFWRYKRFETFWIWSHGRRPGNCS